jgi:Protein of unknown function (DUF2281)
MMLKETLWQEINALPDSRLETLLDFVHFLQFVEKQKSKDGDLPPRIPGLDAGTTWVSDDFDEPLPDSFWLGDAANHEATP